MAKFAQYENKILRDAELPVQIQFDAWHLPEPWARSDGSMAIHTGFPRHWHEHIEIHHILEGEAELQLNQGRYHLKPGNVVIISPNSVHASVCTAAPYRAQVLIFDISDISAEMAGEHYLFQELIEEEPGAADLMHRIFQEYNGKERGYKACCRAVTTALLVYLCRRYGQQSLSEKDSLRQNKDMERLQTVLTYVETHYTEPISNADLAEMVCLSESRFGHLFREKVGRAPLQYINDIRLKNAMRLLLETECTVTEAAQAVGFRDYNHFGRLFRRRHGCTPHEVKSGKIESSRRSVQ